MTNRRESRALLISVGVVALLAGCATMQPLQTPSGAAGFSGPPLGTLSIQRPSGTGPFPAEVLLHTCAGLDRSPQVYDWAPRLTSAGYVAAVVDSFSARGVGFNCGVWKVSVDQVADDALAALAHLRTLPFVDKDRIGVMGFSYGAMAGLRMGPNFVLDAAFIRAVLGSRSMRTCFREGRRLRGGLWQASRVRECRLSRLRSNDTGSSAESYMGSVLFRKP